MKKFKVVFLLTFVVFFSAFSIGCFGCDGCFGCEKSYNMSDFKSEDVTLISIYDFTTKQTCDIADSGKIAELNDVFFTTAIEKIDPALLEQHYNRIPSIYDYSVTITNNKQQTIVVYIGVHSLTIYGTIFKRYPQTIRRIINSKGYDANIPQDTRALIESYCV